MALTVPPPHTMDMGDGWPSPSLKSAIWRLQSKSRYVLALSQHLLRWRATHTPARPLPFCGIFSKNIKAAILRFEEVVIEGGPIALPGAQALLSQIDAGSSPSARGWTIVTSGTYLISRIPSSPTHMYFAGHPSNEHLATNVYTPKALSRTGIPVPAAGYVTADDVERGKPEPDPYLAGAARVGVDSKNCTSTSTC